MQDTPHVYFDLILKCSSLLLCWGFWEEWVRGLDIGRWAVEWGWECFISASSVITYTSKTKLSFLLFSTHTHTQTHPYIYIYIYTCTYAEENIARTHSSFLSSHPVSYISRASCPVQKSHIPLYINGFVCNSNYFVRMRGLQDRCCGKRWQRWERSWALWMWLLLLCRTLSWNWICKQYTILLTLGKTCDAGILVNSQG